MDNNKLTFARIFIIVLALFIAFMLNSCMTYRKAKARYAKTVTDTVRISKQVILSIPKDSVRYRFITDTIPFYDEVQQGRAKVRIEYKNKIVTIKADCDSATRVETVTLKAPQEINTWGIAPWYQTGFHIALGSVIPLILFIIYLLKKSKN